MINNEKIREGCRSFIEEMKSKINKGNNEGIELQVDSDKELLIVEKEPGYHGPQLNITSFILDEELYRQALGFQIVKEDPLLSKFAEIKNIYSKTTSDFNLTIYKIGDDNFYAKFIINCLRSRSMGGGRVIRKMTEELFKYLERLIDNKSCNDTYNSTFVNFQEYLSSKGNVPSITQPLYPVTFTDEQKQAYSNLVSDSMSKLERRINNTMEDQPMGEHYVSDKLVNIHLKHTELGRFNIVPIIEHKRSFGSASVRKDEPLSLISQSYDLYSPVKKFYPKYAHKYRYNMTFIDDLPEFRFMTRSINKDYKIGDGNTEIGYTRRPTARYVINAWDLQEWNYEEKSFQSIELLTRYLKLLMDNPRYKAEYDIEFGQQHRSYSIPKGKNATEQKTRAKYFDTIHSIINATKKGLEDDIDHYIKQDLKSNEEIRDINIKLNAREYDGLHTIELSVNDSKLHYIIPQKEAQDPYWRQNHNSLVVDNAIFNILYNCIKQDQNELRKKGKTNSSSSVPKVTTYLGKLIDQPLCSERYEIYKQECAAELSKQDDFTTKSPIGWNNTEIEDIEDTMKKITEANEQFGISSTLSTTSNNIYLPINQSNDTKLPALPNQSSDGLSIGLIMGISIIFIIPIMLFLAVKWYRGRDTNNHRARGHADGGEVSGILDQAQQVEHVDVDSPSTNLVDVDIDVSRSPEELATTAL